MSKDKNQENYKPYKPEEPVDPQTKKGEQQEIRDASKHAAQEMAAEELGDDSVTREQAEKQLHEAVRKVQEEKKQK